MTTTKKRKGTKRIITVETMLPIFRGCYGTYYDLTDYELEDDEYELIAEDVEEDYKEKFLEDPEMYLNYSDVYQELAKEIARTLYKDFNDENIIKSIENVSMWSPKFYNFENDKIDCTITYNYLTLRTFIKDFRKSFEKYLEANFKSRDGFISFYPHTWDEWFEHREGVDPFHDFIKVNAMFNFYYKEWYGDTLYDEFYDSFCNNCNITELILKHIKIEKELLYKLIN